MKRLGFLLFLPIFVHAQKIAENKIDEFTKHHVMRTSWEMLARDDGFYVHIRLSKIDSILFFDFKWLENEGVSIIPEASRMMLKLDNDSIVTLRTVRSAVSCRGCGSVGFAGSTGLGYDLSFSLDTDAIFLLTRSSVKKIRFYFPDGYVEKNIKDKFSNVLKREFEAMGSAN